MAAWIRARPWALKLFGVLPVLALVALFEATGIRGVNFGYHWDEAGWHIDPAHKMVETGVFMQGPYIYPSFDKYLVVLPAIPSGVRAAILNEGQPRPIQAAMLSAMDSAGYLLRVRGVFIVVSSLAILWLYGAALALRHRRWEALVAAAGLGLSWEFAYHSRWAVTDCINVQFAALTLFMLALFHRTRKSFWIYATAVAAGLSMGTKYTGVFLLVPVLVASVTSRSLGPLLPLQVIWVCARRMIGLCALAMAVYLLTTPATILDPFQWASETRGISSYYIHGHHAGHTVSSAWQHTWIVLTYFGLAFFSPYPAIALLLFVALVAGAAQWLRRDLRFGVVVVGFPLLFLALFCFRYRLVVVRNYLFLTPFLALLLARGIADFAAWLRRPWQRFCLGAALLAVLVAQAAWLVAAGESIRHIDNDAYAKQALDYVRDHASLRFLVSNKIRAIARTEHWDLPANVVKDQNGTRVVFFGDSEGPGSWYWQVNDPWLTEAVFGPREVNLNWYSGWSGHDHVLVMTMDKAKATGVPLAK